MNTTTCRSGYIPCNKRRFWDAELVFFRPGFGFVRVAFGAGGNPLDEDLTEKDAKGNKIDDYLMIYAYTGEPEAETSGSSSRRRSRWSASRGT